MKHFWFFGGCIFLIVGGIKNVWQLGVIGVLWLVFAIVEKIKEDLYEN